MVPDAELERVLKLRGAIKGLNHVSVMADAKA